MLHLCADCLAGHNEAGMRVLIWQEKNQMQGGAESWISDLAAALKALGHSVAWLHSEQIEQAVEAFRPDVVAIGTIHNFIGLAHVERLKALGVPAIWKVHDYWPFCGPRMLMRDHNRSDVACEAAHGECANSCGGRHPVPEVMRGIYAVTGCEGAANILRRHGVRLDAVIEEGIDTDLFRPDASRQGEQARIYSSAAWNAPWKGWHILEKAMRGGRA